jgi:hypothetical protein
MNSPKKKGEIVSVAQTQISPVYQNAIAITAEHYRTKKGTDCEASQFFTQDIEEMAGGVK